MLRNIYSYFKKKTNIVDKNNKYTLKKVFKVNKYKKKKIPKALREQVWINKMGKNFSGTCRISWCENDMTCFNFDCGHNIPESKGGLTNIENLIPICRNCNVGMGNRFTIDEWDKKYEVTAKWYNIKYWI
jgi:5-methylcytosine-specific restriction endonuclease McrA